MPRMNKASYELLAKQYIPDIDLKNCAHIDVGVHGHVLITKDRRVIKIPTVQRAASLYKNEQATLEHLQNNISTNIARILTIIEAPEAPAGYILEMEHASGEELHRQDLKNYSNKELKELGYEIGKVMSELHTMSLNPSLNIKNIPTPDIENELVILKKHAYWNILEPFEQEYLASVYEKALPHFQISITGVPLHNDFGMNHVFVENHKLSAVIDWDCQKIGDPARDWRWAVGPRSIHPICFKEALSTYMKNINTDPSFVGRVLYYNEVKMPGILAKAYETKDNEQFARARRRLHESMESIKFLYDIVEIYSGSTKLPN